MTPFQLNLLILAVVASKMGLALVFLHWIDTRAEKTPAQGTELRDQKHRGTLWGERDVSEPY